MNKIILKNLVPILLFVIALSQIYMVYNRDLTPWKGGGFGMFAMIDRMDYRPVHITLMSSGKKHIVNPKDLLSNNEYNRVKSRPDKNILEKLAFDILKRRWVFNEDIIQSAEYSYVQPYTGTEGNQTQEIILADSVVIQIYKIKMNVSNNEITLEKINHLKRIKNSSDLENKTNSDHVDVN